MAKCVGWLSAVLNRRKLDWFCERRTDVGQAERTVCPTNVGPSLSFFQYSPSSRKEGMGTGRQVRLEGNETRSIVSALMVLSNQGKVVTAVVFKGTWLLLYSEVSHAGEEIIYVIGRW